MICFQIIYFSPDFIMETVNNETLKQKQITI